jgi:signal transduction histidine kinase/DNA-binding response OmpR family regulator/sugar lactone lactonase YvrE
MAVLSLLLPACGRLAAQSTPWRITALTVDDGLSQNEVTDILQDRRGYLWVGTRGGLNRFTGQDFDVFRNELDRPGSLSNSSVECLAEDDRGHIWVGTKSGGISVLDPRSDRFTHLRARPRMRDSLTDDRVIALHPIGDRYVWVGTWVGGTLRYDRQLRRFEQLHPDLRTYEFARHPDGTLWAATTRGLVRFSADGRQIRVAAPPNRSPSLMTLAYHPASGGFVTGRWNEGVRIYSPDQDRWKEAPPLPPEASSWGMDNAYHISAPPGSSDLWIGTWGGGLYHYQPGWPTLDPIPLPPGYPYQVVLCTYRSRDGTTWVGTNGGGLLRIDTDDRRFAVRGTPETPSDAIWSVTALPEGKLWLGTKGSGTYYAQDSAGAAFRAFNPDWRLSPLNVTPGIRSFHYVREEDQLYAASNYALLRFTGSGFERMAIRTIYDAPPRYLTHVTSVYRDRGGYYWIGTQHQGLWRATRPGPPDRVPFRQFLTDHRPGSLRSNRISSFREDAAGNLWIATYHGLHRYRPATDDFAVYLHDRGRPESLSSDIVLCTTLDRAGRLWVGTPNGLNLMKRANGELHFQHFGEADGLSSSYIQALESDRDGNIWAATTHGLTRIRGTDFETTRFDRGNGLPTNSFMENVSARGEDGCLYFGTQAGLVSFFPRELAEHDEPPTVVLRDIKLFNHSLKPPVGAGGGAQVQGLPQSVAFTQAIELAHHENVLTLDFGALNFNTPSTIRYAYRLLGVSDSWTAGSPQRSVTFADLSPGSYRFQVRAARSDRDYGPIRELGIVILPPWWLTSWAMAGYVLLVIGLLYAYRSYLRRRNELRNRLALARMSQQKEVEMAETKARFFTNITHELRTPLTLILGPMAELLQRPVGGRQQKLLATVDQQAQRLLKLVNQLLDFRRVESDRLRLQAAPGNFVPFLHELTLSFRQAAEQAGVSLHFNGARRRIELTYDRNQLEIVFCNLLSNALKYAPAGSEVIVALGEGDDGHVEVRVSDRGPGMPQELADRIFDRYFQIANAESTQLVGTGIGLSLARSIVEAHRGTLTVDTAPGLGSTFVVRLPVGSAHFSSSELIPDFAPSDTIAHYRPGPNSSPKPIVAASDDRPHLLIAEDNPEIRVFIYDLFAADYLLTTAANGVEALDRLTDTVPDLVISDIMMPMMDGLTLCGRIRQIEELAHLPVILLTARTATVHQVDGYRQGADAYVTKPFRPAVLRARVEALLRNRRLLRAHFTRRVTLSPSEVVIDDEDAKWIDAALDYVESQLDRNDLSREEVATALHMSDSAFYRRLKALTGQTFTGFVRALRLKRAAQLLRDSKQNVSQIAFECGFNDLKYFRTCFRDQFGQSPSAYRKTPAPASPPTPS